MRKPSPHISVSIGMRATLFVSLLLIQSCSLFSVKTYTWDWRRDHPEYHETAKAHILECAPQLLTTVPKDITNYCPDYSQRSAEERLEFWGLFLSVVSWMESSHRTEHFYEEIGIIDSTGNNVTSRGLLQFSYESAKGYLPSLSSPEDLHDPNISLKVGAIALKKFITSDCVISSGKKGSWKGAARYWSVVRNNPKHVQIQDWLKGADRRNPKKNLIPPPPHLTPEDYTPWIKRVFSGTPKPEMSLE